MQNISKEFTLTRNTVGVQQESVSLEEGLRSTKTAEGAQNYPNVRVRGRPVQQTKVSRNVNAKIGRTKASRK